MQRFDVMHLATTAICFVLLGGTHASAAGAPQTHKTVTVTLPRAAASNEAVAVRISAGVLPDGARIIVRLPSGEIAGSVTPYGVRTGQKAGIYTIPLPQHAVANGTVTLHLELGEKRGEPRAPTEQEVEKVEVVYVPVSG